MRCLDLATLVKQNSHSHVDLLKLDIEGGEQDLLSCNLEWLKRVDAIIAEFHPGQVDYSGLTTKLQEEGFRYIPANSVFPDNMDSFIREPSAA